jgi:PAS domain S-box-containing protein
MPAMASSRPGSEPLNIQLLVDSIPALIHTATPDGFLDYFNKPWLEYLGATLDQVAGWNWTAVIHPEDVDGIVAKWRASLATGEIFEHETRVRSANGEYRWMFHHKVPLRDANGKIVKWYGTSIDIEDRKRAEIELRKSDALAEERLRLVVDTTPAMINSCRPDGHLDYVNKGWLDYFGLSLEAALDRADVLNMTVPSESNGEGGDPQPIIHPEDLPGLRSHWEATLISGKPDEHEARARRFDGVYRWHLFRAVPLCDETGRPLKWYVSGFDIEDRKRAEEELRNSEFYLAEGQRLGHMGSWAFGPDGFYYWSPELFRMHGLDPASKPPSIQEYLDRLQPQDRESMANLIKGILAQASPFDAITRILHPNGEVRYIRCVGVPVVENQSLKKYVGSAIDVTEHELLTQELRRREAYLTEAQRLSHTGSFGWTVSSGELYWSDETFRIFEYDRSVKPTLDSVVQCVHPGDRADVQGVINRAIAGAPEFEHAYRLLLPDGRVKHVRALAHVLHDASGNHEFLGAVTDITGQVMAEEALRSSEADLLEAQRLSHMGSWRNDVLTGIVTVSPEVHRIFDIRPGEDASTAGFFFGRIHPEDRPIEVQTYERANVAKTDFESDYRIVLPDGSIKYVHNIGHPVLNESGDIREFVGTVIDITAAKRTVETLRESEAYLAEAQRLSHTGSWAYDPATTKTTYMSEECFRVLGLDPKGEMLPLETALQRIHPDDRQTIAEKFERATHERTEFEFDYRYCPPGGEFRDIHQVGHPVLSPSGDLVEFVGTLIDISERKRAEDKIREQEEELRQIVDLVPQLIAVYGANFERFYANRTALDYLGISLDEWRHETFAHSTHPDDSERLKTSKDRALSSGSADEVELRLRKHDGSYRWFLARYNPVRDDKGQITRWYVTATDIEERKQAEDRLRQENVALREEIDKASMFEEIVGTARPLKAVLSRIGKVAPTDSTVLITGETGTGKELVARAIHRRSRRSSRAFVSVNCAAIPRDLIASELFGHEKGSFTGALQRRVGKFELAEGGTIFLDEVGELPTETQIALLRVLQEREFDRVGGTHPIRANVRVIAATNRDLDACVAARSFREDLFYRLNVFPIEIPPLRQRKDDIPILVEYFIDRYARKAGKNIKRVNKQTLELFQSYPWPGNIRELQNVIERSVILCESEIFSIDQNWLPQPPPLTPDSKQQIELPQTLLAQEKDMIEAALKDSSGRVSGPTGAAVKLGIPRSTLESKIRSLEINKNRFKN